MKIKIIADCSSNHMGDMSIAEKMVELGAEAGVDMIKFQSWQAEKLRKDFPDYKNTYNRHLKAELSDEDHFKLIEKCNECGVEFLTTCFDLGRIDFLSSLGLKSIKVASSDCTSFRLLDRLMANFEKLIVSTGMSTDEEIEALIKHVKGHDVTILHCVSIYPAPLDKVNLDKMEWLKTFGISVGFSDHSLGVEASQLAIAMGAEIIEKHYTLSRYLPGKDQAMSTEFNEFKVISEWAAKVYQMRGKQRPELTESEMDLRDIYIGKWGNNK